MSFKWKLARILLYLPFKILFRYKIIGKKNIPLRGPVIICPNHTSFWDPPLVGWASPREVYFLAKKELFTTYKIFGKFIEFYNSIPIDRSSSTQAVKKVVELLNEGKAVVIFPEATRNRTKDKLLLPLKKGAAMIALKAKAPVIPAFLFESKGSYWDWMLGKRELKIRFGKPIFTCNLEYNKENINYLTRELEVRMRELYARG